LIRIVASILTGLALLALGMASHEPFVVGPLAVAALAALFLRVDGPVSSRTYLVLAAPFLVLALVHKVEDTSGLGFNVPFYVSLYLQAVAARKLASSAPKLPEIVFCAASGVATAGSQMEKAHYRVLVVVFGVLLLVALRLAVRPRLPRSLVVPLALLVVLGLTEASVRVLDHYFEDLSRAFLKAYGHQPLPSRGGFSGRATLESIVGAQQGDAASAVALRVFSKRPPGHLRAKSFLDYDKGTWSEEPEEKTRAPEKGCYVLSGRPTPTGDPLLEAYPLADYGRHFFLPLEASALETTSDVIRSFQGGAVESPFEPTSNGYSVFVSKEPVLGAGWTALPKDPVVLAALDATLARFGETKTPFDLMAAIRDHFAHHYTYELGITFRPGVDPIAQFLTEKDHGHCELFATAGALLLRRRGVPARYVTGFLCEEKNESAADLWVARENHAHAWVEYLDRGWQTAEFTPDSGLPHFETGSGFAAWLEAMKGRKDRLVAAFLKQGPLAFFRGLVLGFAAWLVLSWPGRGLLILIIGLLVRRLRRHLPARAPRPRERVLEAALEAERRRYLALERALARRGFLRSPSETLEEFAARVPAPESEQIRSYANLRYGVLGSRP
jgi:hypothetical protein